MCSRKQVSDILKECQPFFVKHAKRNKSYTAFVRNLTKKINKDPWIDINKVRRCDDYNQFTWRDTPEGIDHWSKLNCDIIRLKREI